MKCGIRACALSGVVATAVVLILGVAAEDAGIPSTFTFINGPYTGFD